MSDSNHKFLLLWYEESVPDEVDVGSLDSGDDYAGESDPYAGEDDGYAGGDD